MSSTPYYNVSLATLQEYIDDIVTMDSYINTGAHHIIIESIFFGKLFRDLSICKKLKPCLLPRIILPHFHSLIRGSRVRLSFIQDTALTHDSPPRHQPGRCPFCS